MQPVFGFVPYNRLRSVHDIGGDFLTAMGRKAMHENRFRLRKSHELAIDLVWPQQVVAVADPFVSHGNPDIGRNAIRTGCGFSGIIGQQYTSAVLLLSLIHI